MDSLEYVKENWKPLDFLEYRGQRVNFYQDNLGNQVVGIFNDKFYEFGYYNTQYKEDMKLIIDDFLDTLTRFENDPILKNKKMKLEYFQNGEHKDIRLICKKRILKVYLNENDVISDARETAIKYLGGHHDN